MTVSQRLRSNILGEEFGPFTLVRRLGVGGMAETFVAVRSGPSGFTQRVCLKLVLPFFRENQDFIELFEREARLAAKLRHRNIVGVIDFGEIEGTSYMALELVDGLDLRSLLEKQPERKLSQELVALVGLELAEALEHAHHPPAAAGIESDDDDVQGIVHRDISPSNVLVSRQGEILLSDFGVAKAITGTSRKQSAVKGKVPYMSPEQLRAEALDGRADLFALGVVLYETLAGQRPYDGAHDPATIMLILKGEHPPLAELAPDAVPEFCAAIERLLKPDPNDRPATAAQFIEEIEDFAPSPRARRRLGRLVKEIRQDKVTEDSVASGAPQPIKKTEVLPEVSDPDAAAQPVGSAPAPPERSGISQSDPGWWQASQERDDAPAPPTPQRGTGPLPAESAAPRVSDPVPLVRPPKDERPAYLLAGRASRYSESIPPPPTRSRWPLVAMLAAVGLLGALLYALWPEGEPTAEGPSPVKTPATAGEDGPSNGKSPNTGTIEPPAKPQPKPPQVGGEAPTAKPSDPPPAKPGQGAGTEQAKKPPKPKPKPPPSNKPAKLTVTVFPWGNIWINGKPWGASPLRRETLRAGRYKISVGQTGPTESKTVRLKPGQSRTLRFDLTD